MFDWERLRKLKLSGYGKYWPLFIVMAYPLVHLPWSSPGAASWVQAIGSLIAIGVAIAVPWRLRLEELKRQAEAQRRAEMGQYFQLSKIIGLINRYSSELKDSRGSGLYGPNRLLLYGLFQEVQSQLSMLHAASHDRLLMKLVGDTKVALAAFTVRITPDDISGSSDLGRLVDKLSQIQTDADAYMAKEELEKPQRIGIPG